MTYRYQPVPGVLRVGARGGRRGDVDGLVVELVIAGQVDGAKLNSAELHAAVLAMTAAGIGGPEIARRVKTSQRHVDRIRQADRRRSRGIRGAA